MVTLGRAVLVGGIAVGPLVPQANWSALNRPSASQAGFVDWKFPPGVYTARTFVLEISVLLESVILQLGEDPPGTTPSREIFFESLRSSLSHEGREATLPLSDWKSKKPTEVTQQALKVGKVLYDLAREHSTAVAGDSQLTVYSPCEGHKWVPPAGQLLRSRRSSPILMMLFNEWIHQVTCLRDVLIAFGNFEEVQLNLDNTSSPGTRPIELYYTPILRAVKSGDHNHRYWLEISKVLTAPTLPKGGYGFQYSGGSILPASVFTQSHSSFLRYIPAYINPTHQDAVLFVPSVASTTVAGYDIPPKTLLTGQDIAIEAAKCMVSKVEESLTLTATLADGRRSTVDLGAVVAALEAVS